VPAEQRGTISCDFIGDESAASHYFSCQWQVADSQ
jgi:hypothetical protein